MIGDPLPTAPTGYQCCNVWDGPNRWQINHLVTVKPGGGTPGPTLCGLTRFDHRHPATHALLRVADLPGWSMGGGTAGPGVDQRRCRECWAVAEANPVPPELLERHHG